jgi:4-aminobutyrate aminotransferase/(S)-3-amino-2-methylpropionate transaminase
MDAPSPGGLGGTFAGNPAACEAALAVLDIFEKQDLMTRANEMGDHFQKRAREWQKRWPMIGDVRGLGAMQALELVQSQETREPAAQEVKESTQYCYEHGLITISAGSYGNVIRLLMPLVITDEQLDEGLDVLEGALKTVYERKHEAAAQPV